MRREYLIAIVLAVAAIPAGATLMVAPEYLHLTGIAIPLTFWGGIGLTLAFIAVAVVLALRGEAQSPRFGHVGRVAVIIGAALVLIAVAASAIWYLRQPPTPSIASAPNRPFQSRGNKYIFECPKPAKNEKRSREEILAQVQRNAVAVGGTFGVLITVSEIPQGVRLEILPNTAERKLQMNGITKIIFEARATETTLLVVVSMEVPEPLNLIFSLMPIDPNSKDTIQMKHLVEQMTEAPEGKCRLL